MVWKNDSRTFVVFYIFLHLDATRLKFKSAFSVAAKYIWNNKRISSVMGAKKPDWSKSLSSAKDPFFKCMHTHTPSHVSSNRVDRIKTPQNKRIESTKSWYFLINTKLIHVIMIDGYQFFSSFFTLLFLLLLWTKRRAPTKLRTEYNETEKVHA